jgi:hypothetical protein
VGLARLPLESALRHRLRSPERLNQATHTASSSGIPTAFVNCFFPKTNSAQNRPQVHYKQHALPCEKALCHASPEFLATAAWEPPSLTSGEKSGLVGCLSSSWSCSYSDRPRDRNRWRSAVVFGSLCGESSLHGLARLSPLLLASLPLNSFPLQYLRCSTVALTWPPAISTARWL